MSKLKFRKIGSNEHGQIVEVFNEGGFAVGVVEKWHGLFITRDWKHDKTNLRTYLTRKDAAKALRDEFHQLATGTI